MVPPEVERKLAAILSADVVGYSRLMAEDEAATIRTLTAYRQQIAILVQEHRGRIVDSPGDNILAEFPTGLDAVQGAVEIQRVIQARNADLPAERRMQFRIGVHLGDISVEGERVYGDGVNVAARLEGLAQPGGVCISDMVYNQVEKKLTVDLEDLGEQTLKNIARPVHVYGMKLVLPGPEREEPEKDLPGMDELTVPGFSGRPAIAVLPFDNLSGDPEQEYFADGIAEDIISRLSAYRFFPVIARNSSFVYKGKAVDVKRVSQELGVRYVVEGSVRKAGDRVRISAQLIDATTGSHLWAERYDRDLSDIFAVQDEITEAMMGSMGAELWKSEWQRTLRQEPQALDAWDCFHRGWWHFRQYKQEENAKARSLFQRASELDPHFARSFASLAYTHQADILYQWSSSVTESLAESERAARRAVMLDDNDGFGHLALGAAHRLAGRLDEAVRASELAIRLDPSFASNWHHLGVAFAMMGRPDEAVENIQRAIRLSPQDIFIHEFLQALAFAHFAAGRYEEALEWAQRSYDRKADYPLTQGLIAAIQAQLGQLDKARNTLTEGPLTSMYSVAAIKLITTGWDADVANRLIDGLRKAGLKE